MSLFGAKVKYIITFDLRSTGFLYARKHMFEKNLFQSFSFSTSRMVQWLGFLAFTQAARVRFPVWERFGKIMFHYIFYFKKWFKKLQTFQRHHKIAHFRIYILFSHFKKWFKKLQNFPSNHTYNNPFCNLDHVFTNRCMLDYKIQQLSSKYVIFSFLEDKIIAPNRRRGGRVVKAMDC